MFLKFGKKGKIEALKKRDQEIEAKYLVDDATADVQAIMKQGKYLGIYEQLVRILHRNTDNIPESVKELGFFKLALVTYVDIYCQEVVAPEFPEGAKDVGTIAISKYYNMDYEKIVDLPESISNEDVHWVNATRRMVRVFGINNETLLWLTEQFMTQLTGQEVHYSIAEEFKPKAF